MKEVLIIGAGSVGGHIACNFLDYFPNKSLLGFLDDDLKKVNHDFLGFPVLGKTDDIVSFSEELEIVFGIAFPVVKGEIVSKFQKLGYKNFPSLISPYAWVSKNVKIGAGSIIYPGTSINYNCQIDEFVVMNMNCAVGHDCSVRRFASFAPNVSLGGHTNIGEYTEMGIGANTIQSINIGRKSVIGAGSVVIHHVGEKTKIVGNPGRILE